MPACNASVFVNPAGSPQGLVRAFRDLLLQKGCRSVLLH
ncbi:hypothetical protein ASZ90_009268 [hydrocarbon metagenome]|uniref:Uncharacterized protein n=1 Tax=hydrocarbon metagenome TaxID=938273 RepID=A0A0W8FJA7_9ZZZZ